MTYQEFQRQLGKAGLTVKEFSELVGMTPNAVTNYARKPSVPSHLAVIAKLMGEMAEHQVDFRRALADLDIKPKRPRGAKIQSRPSQAPHGGQKNVSSTKGERHE
ncbi:helix-turn-helix domain-containing protein [Halomonas denitrificans]|uniref:helix-turn-helix domain-containing protein n=1 Tax=Halomonas denitrificans TaxID=370769 RepID=UPI001FEA7ACF|nr:helix-turn-helix transcriptional regulator [Halomonas denitrificans]